MNNREFRNTNTGCMAFEYELLDIIIDFGYEIPDEEAILVCEDDSISQDIQDFVPLSENELVGIPKGNSQAEIDERREIIHNFIQQWRKEHKENPFIYNENLKENIKITQVFMIESVAHAVSSYKSTKAVLLLDEVIAKAHKLCYVRKKEGNSNQKPFTKMLVMRYKSEELGDVKMLVGIRNRTNEKVEYSITVPSPDTPFIDEKLRAQPKNAKKKKRPT